MKAQSIITSVAVIAAAFVSTASATQLNAHAASFQAYSGTDQQYINHWLSGVSNSATVSKTVIGTPARNPHSAGNQTVSVTGWNNAVGVTTYCTVYSYNSSGTYMSSKALSATGVAGYWLRSVSFTTVEAPSDASYAVYCTLLASGANRIHSTQVTP